MPQVLSVTELNNEISSVLRRDYLLQNCWVKGEISNFKRHSPSGHCYFSVKDEKCSLRAVMFRTAASLLTFSPENGLSVMLRGNVRFYEKDGNIQIYVEEILPSGLGAMYLAFEQLKRKLEAEGFFAASRKRAIPKYPARIAIVTSATGAAIRDMMNVTKRRNPYIALLLAPATVQGETAPLEIAQAIGRINQHGDSDVIIVGRGGGSLEELWAFNTEIVARAIFNSKIPVISAVGHEVDFTIADFVADMRAPTPSAAAELAVPLYEEMKKSLALNQDKLEKLFGRQLETKRTRLRELKSEAVLAQPFWRMNNLRQDLDMRTERLQKGITGFLSEKNDILKFTGQRLNLLSPLAVLSRGYAIAQDDQGGLVKSIEQISAAKELFVRLIDGIAECEVKKIQRH
ncbi:Exodeoxyribonuclease VII large subunit [Syntrophobotulus glycolicus DSM 8271]|uniref:Exodeoxyribonuclease 7 large subunit n=1 Tax=Syntrophobotulus glycolicus (strain DSM 8271 / FlGlyR) TaxID=645991 RepID=F0T0A0_SYNGF|nr:exodeoxyribonuclease VII large subunit [Syntrophobotulus glycolicus]ADY56187.1 Exodeoxyribonuclease VII large subunit [Syntrophobotulus glycolicus DSM 8271]